MSHPRAQTCHARSQLEKPRAPEPLRNPRVRLTPGRPFRPVSPPSSWNTLTTCLAPQRTGLRVTTTTRGTARAHVLGLSGPGSAPSILHTLSCVYQPPRPLRLSLPRATQSGKLGHRRAKRPSQGLLGRMQSKVNRLRSKSFKWSCGS